MVLRSSAHFFGSYGKFLAGVGGRIPNLEWWRVLPGSHRGSEGCVPGLDQERLYDITTARGSILPPLYNHVSAH